MNPVYDLAIIGGGMVGASLARAASRLGLRTLVVEAAAADPSRLPNYDDRAIALAHGSRRILESFGVWPGLQDRAAPIRRIHVSDRGHFGFTRLSSGDHGLDALGYVVAARALGQALVPGLDQLPGVTLASPARLLDFRDNGGVVQLELEQDGQRHTPVARLLVAADGARSGIRQQLGIATREWNYHQAAVIANLRPGLARHDTAFERFTDSGPLAMLPLADGRYALVWTVHETCVDEVMGLSDTAFLTRVQERFGMRLGRLREPSPRVCYPLHLIRALEQGRGRVLLLGNAAHAVHPITGQGFNLGLRDVAVLADLMYEARRDGREIGDAAMCRAYAAARIGDQRLLALVTDSLVRIFTNPLLPVRWGRDIGLTLLDNAPLMKRLVTERFMGLGGRLPRPARGLPLNAPGRRG